MASVSSRFWLATVANNFIVGPNEKREWLTIVGPVNTVITNFPTASPLGTGLPLQGTGTSGIAHLSYLLHGPMIRLPWFYQLAGSFNASCWEGISDNKKALSFTNDDVKLLLGDSIKLCEKYRDKNTK